MRKLRTLAATVVLCACYGQHELERAPDASTRRPSARDASIAEVPKADASTAEVPNSDASTAEIPDAGAFLAEEAYLKSTATAPEEAFGWMVAVDGDTLVVGAPNDDRDATASGAAYVFVRKRGVWSEQAYLKASHPGAKDSFGTSVAISGDTLVVGAPDERGRGVGVNADDTKLGNGKRGAAYVFVRTGQRWTQQAYLKSSGPAFDDPYTNQREDHFGSSVSVSRDTLVVGAPREQSNATGVNGDDTAVGAPSSGAAFVFVRKGGTWEQQAYLKASNTAYFALFGTSLAIAGNTIVVGAPGEASFVSGVDGDDSVKTAGGSGAAYVFVRDAEVWRQQAFLKASNAAELMDEGGGDRLGASVALSGDTVVAGAPCERSNARGIDGDQINRSYLCSGAAYVFARSRGQWTQQAYLKSSNSGDQDRFGTSVACSGDSIVVGAPQESSDATGIDGDQSNNRAKFSGAVYLFARRGPAWTQRAYLKASNTRAGEHFGTSVALANDTIAVGAHFENAPDRGAVYLFR